MKLSKVLGGVGSSMLPRPFFNNLFKGARAACLPEAKCLLALVLLGWFSIALSAGIITVEPNGVITPGSTLSIHIQLPAGLQAVDMEIARLEQGGEGKGSSGYWTSKKTNPRHCRAA